MFYGSELSHEMCEERASKIPGKILALEEALNDTKWYDYRGMHYMRATYLFVQKYREAVQHFTRTAVCHETSKYVKGLKQVDFLEAREHKSFFQCRQLADSMGIEYGHFLILAMNFAIEMGWQQPPRPTMIRSRLDMQEYIDRKWREITGSRVMFASDDCYLESNWAELPHQVAYREWLVKQIRERGSTKYALHSAICIKGHLSVESASSYFSDKEIQDAISLF